MENEENKNVMEETTESTTKRGRKPVEKTEEKIVEKVVENQDSQKRIDELEAKLATMMDLMTKFMATTSNQAPAQNVVPDHLKEIKIVHLVQRAPGLSTYIKLSNLEIILTEFGEERYLTLQQFEEMVGKYRRWFDSGMISLADGYDDIARRYGLKTARSYPMDSYFIANMGTLSMDDIEKMYDRLPLSGKEFIISYWTRKVIEGDPNFKDRRKLEALDRISDGGMESILIDVKNQK